MVSERQLIAGGKYELQRLLGRGSMGEVWLARHTSLEGAYAVKLTDVRAVPDAAGRFQMEAHIAARLSKKTRHIVSVTDHGEEGDLAYLVMELLEGESLDSRIGAAGSLTLIEVAAIVNQVSRALVHAQAEGFVHRDLKPGNVFLTKDEDGHLVAKVLDFGIARAMTRVQTRSPFATAKDMLVGTPSYMSPEQALALDTIDHRCDVWALAVLTYEALTGRLPFEGESIQDVLIGIGIGRRTSIREHRPDLPEAIDAFYDRAFAEKIDDRFATASELAAAFARIAGVDSASRPSFGPPTPMVVSATQTREASVDPSLAKPVPTRTRRAVWMAIGLLALASTAAAIGAIGVSGRRSSSAPHTPASDRATASSGATTATNATTPADTPAETPPAEAVAASATVSEEPPLPEAVPGAPPRRQRAPRTTTVPTTPATTAKGPAASASALRAPATPPASARPHGSPRPVDRGEVF
jgi:serine/threonine-protein kinase